MEPVLSVRSSVSQRFWRMRAGSERDGIAIAQALQVPELIGRMLAQRGQTLDTAPQFLAPRLRDFLPNPSCLKDMDKAAEIIADQVMRGGKLGLLGDYDVDGATSAALFLRFFRQVGVRDVFLYVPDRQKEGYGPNRQALESLRNQGADLVLTLDCGIVSFDALQAAHDASLPVIVVDHHIAEPRLPKAAAIVNPNRLDDESGQGQLAAVGVAFLLAIAVNRQLKQRGYYTQGSEPDLLQLLDIVALGTICDVVPLTGTNRALVAQGLKVMAQRTNPGLVALADVAELEEAPNAYHVGFLLGPRINAGGRVGQSDLGARLLATDDPMEAARLATLLDGYNRERREIESVMLDQALLSAEQKLENGHRILIVSDRNWHPGIIGIIAGRLKDRYLRPTLALAIDASGRAKGSGRSVPGFHLGNAIIAAREAGLLLKGGGHAMAAGFEIEEEHLPAFSLFLEQRMEQIEEGDLLPLLEVDGLLQSQAASRDLCSLLEQLGPFGSANPQPVFALPDVQVLYADPVGQGPQLHLRCQLAGSDGKRLKAIAFRAAGTPLGNLLLQSRGQRLHLAGTIKPDDWNGRKEVQFIIEDAAPVA